MGKFDGVLVATDYDDTLYDSRGTISPENRAALAYFVAQGGRFTVSTGRSYINFAIQMAREDLPVNAPVILSNGACIHDFARGETLWEKTLPLQAPQHLEAVCAALPQVGLEAYHGNDVYVFRPNVITEKHLAKCRLTGLPRPLEEMPLPWVKAILQHPDTACLEAAQDCLLSAWPGRYEITFSNPTLLEVTARGANKGRCVLWLAKRLGIRREHIYCVGNGLNDIPMLKVSARSFAPANSYAQVKQAADVLLPSCDEHCLARMIEELDGMY